MKQDTGSCEMTSTGRHAFNRRSLLRATALGTTALGTALGTAAGGLSGCAMGGGSDNNGGAKGNTDTANPLGVKEDAPLEVVLFNGGFGEDYAKNDETLYRQRYPKAQVKHSSTQKIAETLQPRFVAGDPPDVVDNGGTGAMDTGGLVTQSALTDLADLMAAPSLDNPKKTVKDTLRPGIVDGGTYNGKMINLSYAYTVYGIWYSQKLFTDRGWQYPKTWDDMIALCRTIKAAGISPWTYQGKYPRYMNWPILVAAGKMGGPDVLRAIDNLEPNAWRHPAVKAAVDAFSQLVTDKFIQPGAQGMDHIQSQTEWCRGNAALISCGSWLENEQKSVTPAGFEMTVAPVPSLTGTDKLPFAAIRGNGSESFIVPAKAKNVRGGLDFLRVMLSRKASADFTTKVSSLTCVQGAEAGLTLPPGLGSATRVLDAAGTNVFMWMYAAYYGKLERETVEPATGDLLTGRITAAQWVDRCQQGADAIAKDTSVTKFHRS
jgi:N-acetylglucosamine transport system substrate-binding protein